MAKFDTKSFIEGALEGVITQIDRRAKEKQKEIELQRDITKYKIQKDYDAKLQKDWLTELTGQYKQLQAQQGGNFITQTRTPATGLAELFGSGRIGQVPYVSTEETETGRQPMMESDINMEAASQMERPAMTSTGISMKPVSARDKMLTAYQQLKEAKESGKALSPQAEYIYKGLTQKLGFAPKKEESITESKRGIIGIIRGMKNDNRPLDEINQYITFKGYAPEDFNEELKEYTPTLTTKPSLLQNISQSIADNPAIKKVSEAISHIMQNFNQTKEQAIETLKNIQGQNVT